MSAGSSEAADAATPGPDDRASGPLHRYTRAELALCDGSDPERPTLIAYKGKVYDVSKSFPWARGRHWRGIRAGNDLSTRLDESIHGEEMLERVPCVGVLID